MAYRDNTLLRSAATILQEAMPRDWELSSTAARGGPHAGVDARLRISAPRGGSGEIEVILKRAIEPRQVATLLTPRGTRAASATSATRLVVAPFLSAAVRELLEESGVSYLDLTGNIKLEMARPGLYIRTQGAEVNPNPKERPSRSLRGARAGRVVRVLIESATPPGVRALAQRASVDPGYVSRIVALLDREALVTREGRGRIASVDWQRLLRRWAQDAPLELRGEQAACLEPRGLNELNARLKKLSTRYAITGSSAAGRYAPVAPPRLATVYAVDVEEAIEKLGLRRTDSGANVLMIEPKDDGVFVGSEKQNGLEYVAPCQAAADLLTSPGRGPAEAEELIGWMASHEEVWRG